MQKKLITIFTIIFSFLLIVEPVHAFTMGSVNFTIDGANFDNGGGDSSSPNYLIVNSTGENVLAQASNTNFTDNPLQVFFNPTPTPTSAPTSSSASTSTTTTSATPTPTTTAIAQASGTGGSPTITEPTSHPEEQTPPLFDIEVGPGSLASKKREVPILVIIAATVAAATALVVFYVFKRRKKRTNET